jgi:multimeric flavodoxin WrbA
MKLMAIIGSPRKGGNTELLVDQVIAGCKSKTSVDLEKFFVIDKNIGYCDGCLACMSVPPSTEICVIKDDMAEILEQMVASDAFIFGTPNHNRTITAPLLNFFSRMLPLFEMRREYDDSGNIMGAEYTSLLQGKKSAMVFTQGDPFFSSALVHEVLERNLVDFRIRRVGDVMSIGNLKKGVVADKKDELKKAFDLGVKLASFSGLR